jgi:hypothetical protein
MAGKSPAPKPVLPGERVVLSRENLEELGLVQALKLLLGRKVPPKEQSSPPSTGAIYELDEQGELRYVKDVSELESQSNDS